MRILHRHISSLAALSTLLFPLQAARAQDDKDTIRQLQLQLEVQKRENQTLQDKLQQQEAVAQAQKATIDQLKKDIDRLQALIKNPEQLKLLDENRQLQLKADRAEEMFRFASKLNEKLQDQVRELTVRIARLEAGKEPDRPILPKDGKERNPPPVAVEGKILKIKDNLVEISLGTDHGIKPGHTLEVYRLQPEAKYLGAIRIVDAGTHTSVGRFLGKTPMIKEGDLVTSKLK
jgi:chromosome segregation ATPase